MSSGSEHRPAVAFVWLSRAKVRGTVTEREVEERWLIQGEEKKKRAWDEVERPTSQLVKWSSCRSRDASLTAFCRIEGATSKRRRGGGVGRVQVGVRVVDWTRPLYTDPEYIFKKVQLWIDYWGFFLLALLLSNQSQKHNKGIYFFFFTGTVYWGVMLPPSMLNAEGAAIFFLQHALQKPAVKAKTSTNLTIDAHTSGFPRPLLQI